MTTATDFRAKRKSQARALLTFILIMLGIAGGMGWLVARGLARNETWFPAGRISNFRVVDRDQEPAMFWAAVGLYGILCGGAAGFAAWLTREGVHGPDGVFRSRAAGAQDDGPEEHRPTPRPEQKSTMTLDEARALVAQTSSPKARAAAEQLLKQAIAFPQLSPAEQAAASIRIHELDLIAPDYQLSSFGASVLETIGDSHVNPVVKKMIYAEAARLAARYASGASSGGEGTARSMHVREIEAKLHAI